MEDLIEDRMKSLVKRLVERLKRSEQQIIDAENVIRELTLSAWAQGEIVKKYWNKYEQNND